MAEGPRVVVVGSSNTDMVVRAPHLPAPGETVLGGEFSMLSGGKGANQAVAAARLGGRVTFVARVGTDAFGDNAVRGFEAEGIATDFVVRDPAAPSGIALIGVDQQRGENAIIVAPGANGRLGPDDVARTAHIIRSADAVLCQLEIPLETVAAALTLARDAGVLTILNPAPAQPLPPELLAAVSLLTPNEAEAAFLAGVAGSPSNAARELRRRGVGTVIVTLGAEGALIVSEAGEEHIAGRRVARVVDTTAAGDCFTGALAVALGEKHSLEYAVHFANAAAALSVTRPGAQPSLPTRAETRHFLHDES